MLALHMADTRLTLVLLGKGSVKRSTHDEKLSLVRPP